MEEDIRDFNLIDEDFEEFMRRGRESLGLGEEEQHDGYQERH